MTEKEIRVNLARNIKTFRAIRGFSQAELAEKSDISVAFMSQIVREQISVASSSSADFKRA